jgi:hypothetical protein
MIVRISWIVNARVLAAGSPSWRQLRGCGSMSMCICPRSPTPCGHSTSTLRRARLDRRSTGRAPGDTRSARHAGAALGARRILPRHRTGARARFGSHVIDPALKESAFVVQRIGRAGGDQRSDHRPGPAQPDEEDRVGAVHARRHRVVPGPVTGVREKLVSRPAGESVDVTMNPAYDRPAPPRKDMGRRLYNDYRGAPQARCIEIDQVAGCARAQDCCHARKSRSGT